MTPLETATLDELFDEIKRRSEAGIILVAGQDPKNKNTFVGRSWGSNMWKIGACRFMEGSAMRDLNDEPEIEE